MFNSKTNRYDGLGGTKPNNDDDYNGLIEDNTDDKTSANEKSIVPNSPAETPDEVIAVVENKITIDRNKMMAKKFFGTTSVNNPSPEKQSVMDGYEFSPSAELIAKKKAENEFLGKHMVPDGYAGNAGIKILNVNNTAQKQDENAAAQMSLGGGICSGAAFANLLVTRVAMGTNGIPDYGPCCARSLFGVAETRTHNNMTPEQIRKGFDDLAAAGCLDMSKGNEYYVKDQVTVINYALDVLGSNERCVWLGRQSDLSKDNLPHIPVDSQASLVKDYKNKYGYGHYGEGDAKGNAD